ncbi:Superoxide-generating NADPH oxidase heavy chain subunit B [Micractinium conductrix]|uniref:Superoxide-generating NADPH oxidase heavy chain subunit B n=1 Tax=Micractinium conductrix TaxID=554055 RepID=A0A2P6VHV5_9CHLO|nr:Superoxide-generating NADPH oxidase heavy chain subunit B [Micractinium conductrix]|eukprot:PSC73660.1 Superoxide-generating NADPH oxidase heavy chain subunit B [Micractinium conductrix]
MLRGAAAAARGGLLCTIAACAGAFASWLIIAVTPTVRGSTAIKEGLKLSSLSGSTVLYLLLVWLPLLLATLATLALRCLGRDPPTQRARVTRLVQVKRVLATQLPPRAFLAYWCGGLSVGEGLGVLAWFGLNGWWLGQLLRRSLANQGEPMAWTEQLDKVAEAFGKILSPNLMLLFLPVPHCSFITQLCGVSRNSLIRYHRWLGHGTLWVLNLHALSYYLFWGVTHSFWVEFTAWEGKVCNLAGSLGYFSAMALWVSSLSFVRRRMYQLFFRFHIACFLGFFFFALVHYAPCWQMFAPGLLLYGVDVALRCGQLANVTPVAAAAVDEATGIATIQLKADKSLQHRPLSEVWVLVPEISRWAWHPFTVASGGGPYLTLHVKRYGDWTKSLLEGLRQRSITAVRVSGPHGASEEIPGYQLSPPDSWRRYDRLVMIGGGVGITGLLSVLRRMAAERAADAPKGLPSRVVCVWTARKAGEFGILDAALVQAATAPGGLLDLRLHLTAAANAAASSDVELQPADSGAVKLDKSDSFESGVPSQGSRQGSFKDSDASSTPEGEALLPARAVGAAPFCWSMLRPVQPRSFGVAHLAAVNALTFLGAFCGVVLAASYSTQVSQWRGGVVYAVLAPAVALGLAFPAVFPLRYWRARKAAASGGKVTQAESVRPYGRSAALQDSACRVGEACVSVGDTSLRFEQGRPDVTALLCAAGQEAGAGGVVGVYAAGPRPLMTAVHLAVSALNGSGKAEAHLELHREAVEL